MIIFGKTEQETEMQNTKMKNRIKVLIAAMLVFTGGVTVMAQQKQGWRLIWQDEFNYTGLPDTRKWDYETGHIRNQEKQYYTNARKENIWVDHGVLTITGRKEKQVNAAYQHKPKTWKEADSLADYTSASINTMGKAGWLYGRIEVRAKLPQGGGMWPAIWMLGTNKNEVGWPACGEIDIMEFIGNHPKDIYGTVHFPDTVVATKHHSDGSKILVEKLHEDFHVYAIEWNHDRIDVFFDDSCYHSFKLDKAGKGNGNPFRKPQYLLINLAMGANWPGPIDDKVLPQQLVVDYVRVYRKRK